MTGRVTDKTTGEPLAYANVYYSDRTGKITLANWGTATDYDGRYTLEPGGGFYVTASYVGYKPLTITDTQNYTPGKVINFALEPVSVNLNVVEIVGEKINKNKPWAILAGLSLLAVLAYKYIPHGN